MPADRGVPQTLLEIEREAREEARAQIAVLENTPLVFGEHIAWAVRLYGWTDSLSPVHRVGFPVGDDPYTTCGEPIPHPLMWFTLNDALVRTMSPCRFCEAEHARLRREGREGAAA